MKEAKLRFGVSGGILQKFIVEIPELDINKATRQSGQIVADLLDAISFYKRLPLSIRHIEVQNVGDTFRRRYITCPYSQREFKPNDLTQATTVPHRLKPALRLFREGLSSSRPPYRLLCLYKVREIVLPLQKANNKKVLAQRMKLDRPARVMTDNELNQQYFPTYVGKKVGAFLDYVRSEYRLSVAHGNLDDYFKLVLDPAEVRIDHRLDFTNAALMPVISELIHDEIDFMNRHDLSEPKIQVPNADK